MKKYVKVLSLVLAALLVFACLAACSNGGSTTPANTGETKPADSGSTAEPETAQPENSGGAAEAETTKPADAGFTTANAGKLTMATNAAFPPYEYIEGNKIVGIDAEICAAIAEKLGLEPQIDDMEFDSIIMAVKGGKADIGLAGMTVTPERQEEVNFTDSYATGVQVIIVTEDSAITSADDLFAEGANYTIGVQRNTTGDLYTTWDLEDEGLATIDRYSKGADAVQALKTGKVDCVVIDNEPAKNFVAEVEGLKILDTEYVEEQYAGAMSKDNEALYNAVNDALKELIADGTVQAIIEKYIPAK
ncbi:MAG: amino acid ABC transporter substrate-binding protein [Oscillospiraceae bacterium]|nr:amino acid ABC transporter substrate-binding protein [Oscillospiraceae bacterium]